MFRYISDLFRIGFVNATLWTGKNHLAPHLNPSSPMLSHIKTGWIHENSTWGE